MSPTGSEEIRPPWSRSDRRVPRAIVRPLQEFVSTSSAAAVVLLGAVALALVWVNSPWWASYEQLWHTPLVVQVGDITIGTDLHFWVQDGLMTFFFLLVGLEIKREVTVGELRNPKAVALPAIAAVGGMVVPALVYLAVAHGASTSRGWGVPMATDIALALGALGLATRSAPSGLKPLLLTLAIVDDIGSIVVIALFYSTGGQPWALLAALAIVGAVVAAHRLFVRVVWVYLVLGVLLWYALYRAGVHPTIAGVIMGLLTPARPIQRPAAVSKEAVRIAAATSDDPDPIDADVPEWLELAALSRESIPPLARVEHTLLPWSSFVIVPLFALASAGVRLSIDIVAAAFSSAVAIGIFLGLVLGKPVGVFGASMLARWSKVGEAPPRVGTRAILGLGVTAGIGFTVALFIAELAFPEQPAVLAEAKISILAASVVAGVAGNLVLRFRRAASD